MDGASTADGEDPGTTAVTLRVIPTDRRLWSRFPRMTRKTRSLDTTEQIGRDFCLFAKGGTKMAPTFRGVCRPALAGISLLALIHCGRGDDCVGPDSRGIYVGVFGGGGVSSIPHVSQVGTALFPESRGGPLAVNATGNSGNHGVGLVGLQIGHEWSGCSFGAVCNSWSLLPAAEMEAYYLAGTQRADLSNPTPRLPAHDFLDTFPMNNAVFVTNLVLSVQTPYGGLTSYVGGGIGAAAVTISGADSLQVAPAEAGVNHFNSGPDSSNWGFAAQAKTGLRFPLSDRCWMFAEYRYLYVSSTTYTFGSTQYPTHVPTTPWTVHFGDMSNHMGVGGIGFSF